MATMRRFIKNPDNNAEKFPDLNMRCVLNNRDVKCGLNMMRLMGIFVVSLMLFSVLFSVSMVLRDPPSDGVGEASSVTVFQVRQSKGI